MRARVYINEGVEGGGEFGWGGVERVCMCERESNQQKCSLASASAIIPNIQHTHIHPHTHIHSHAHPLASTYSCTH